MSPLLESLAALTLAAPVSIQIAAGEGDAPDTSEPIQISLALQDDVYPGSLAGTGVVNDAWAMSGYATGPIGDARDSKQERMSQRQEHIQTFIDMSREEIRAYMTKYLESHLRLSPQTTRTVIIDIEYPVHPRDLWKLLGGEDHDRITTEFTEVVKAFGRRYAVAREMLPNATLTVFNLGSPGSAGVESDVTRARLHAEVLATRMGMLEHVNAISPALYERFGPKDRQFESMERTTRQSLAAALEIVLAARDSAGTTLDIIPMLSLTVFNASTHSESALEPGDLGGIVRRIELLEELGVRRVIIWNGDHLLHETEIKVGDRLRALASTRRGGVSPDNRPTPGESSGE